jgi:hypothetical protein
MSNRHFEEGFLEKPVPVDSEASKCALTTYLLKSRV